MKLQYEYRKNSRPMNRDLSGAMRRVADYMVSSTQRKITGGIAPPNAPLTRAVKQGSKTLRDTGGLLASFAGRSDRTSAQVGTNKKQARILQEGGTITPKKAKSLAIPASARTRTMMRRYGARPRSCITGMKGAGYSVWTQGSVIMARKGKKGRPFVLFILKKSVKIPARPFLYIDKQDEAIILEMIRRELGYER
ncbi:MAG: phage virion morphogenesis protein [Spirochaetaceae bacterium]|nr:phage virion morphogenesis protein [Spirochaetaceae bacterium]